MNVTSDLSKISYGVPQGSLLGPLLFILYINDIYRSSEKLSFILYADDTNVLCSNKDLPSLFNDANNHLSSVCEWFQANRLSLNLQKCNYMIFCNKKKKCDINNLKITISDHKIPKVDFTKFLGVYIDSRLAWKVHITEICKKISKSIGIISRLKSVFPNEILRTLYCSLILPYLSYGNTSQSNLYKIKVLQKKVIRIIAKCHFRAHTAPLFKQYNLLCIHDINIYQQCMFMYKHSTNQLPHHLVSTFKINSNFHQYQTRSSSLFHLPRHRTAAFQHSLLWSGPCNWNNLPAYVTSCRNTAAFQRKLKAHIVQNLL